MHHCFGILISVSILIIYAQCESTTETTETVAHTYSDYINASRDLDKSDRVLMRRWSEEFQLQLLNISSQYRLDMTRHREHSFMVIKANPKWNECINIHRVEINNAESAYFASESKCLKSSITKESKKKHAVSQMSKEIRKWRKSYRYLISQCNANHPGDDEAVGECVVEYIQNDNYYVTFQRLILLKVEAMSELYSQILSAQIQLEDCLKTTLAGYLNTVRSIVGNLNRCYKRTAN